MKRGRVSAPEAVVPEVPAGRDLAAQLPLRHVEQIVKVRGLEAGVTVRQIFANTATRPVEAVYVFPLPSEAKVTGVEMQIGSRKIVAELRKREEAKQRYEEARDAGQHASLVEQERPNIFTMSVAGIEPGEQIRVEVQYLAPVPWQAGGGRLRIPLVVAPRFIPGVPVGKQAGGWSPDTDKVPDASRITPLVAEKVDYVASLELELAPGFRARLASPTHPEIVGAGELARGESRIFRGENIRPDRDIVVTYEMLEAVPQVTAFRTSFAAPDGSREEFVTVELVPGAAPSTEPLDVVLCLDRSGSMSGEKIEGLRRVTRKVLDRLTDLSRPVRVGIVAFDSTADVLMELVPVGEKHKKAIKDIKDQGGTELGPALTESMKLFGNEDDDRERCVVVVTDGQTESITHFPRKGVRVHGVGLDTAVNDATIKETAERTGGRTEWIVPSEDYDAAAGRIVALASGPVVRDVAVRGLPKEAHAVGVRDLFASRPTTIVVKFPEVVRGFTVTGRTREGRLIEWPVRVPDHENSRLGAHLWAQEQIRTSQDKSERTTLSLRYGLVGPTTAFVAVSVKEKPGEKPERVDIPVLLPATWDYAAVFGHLPAPAAAAMLAMSRVSIGGMHSARRVTAPPGVHTNSMLGSTRGFRGGGGAKRPASPPDLDSGDADAFVGAIDAVDEVVEEALPDEPVVGTPTPEGLEEARKLIEQAEQLLAGITAGLQKSTGPEVAAFVTALGEAGARKFKGWAELDCARLYLVCVQLVAAGCTLDIPKKLTREPTDVDARRLWRRAQKITTDAEARP